MLFACSIFIVKPGAKVITIEPSADALSMEARAAHSHNCHEQKKPVCCGQPMLEIIDD